MDTAQIVVGLSSLLISVVFFLSTLANGAILYVFVKDKKLRNSSTIFITNLAVVGILQGGIVFPLLQVETILGQRVIGSNRIACLVRTFINELATSASLYALLLVAVNRYSVVLLKHRHKRFFTTKKSVVLVMVSWLVCACFATGMAFNQFTSVKVEEFKCRSSLWYPRGTAALQFTVLGFPFALILSINGLLLVYFIQDRNGLPLPAKFYSQDSMERRMAPGKKRRLTKNIRVLALTVVSFLSCHMIYIGCLLLAMFTGKFIRLSYVTSLSLVCFGCVVHPYLYGYLNKRLKRPLQRTTKRMRHFLTCRHKNREGLVTTVSSCSFTSSKISTLNRMTEASFIDNEEITRSKMSNRLSK